MNGNSGQKILSKSLSQAKLEDRKKKGLCFLCDLKYSPGHKCSKSQLYQLIIEPLWEQGSDMKSPSSEYFQDYSEHLDLTDQILESPTLVLSLYALQGLQGHNTMRFPAVIGHTEVVVLVDFGSTHNFIDYKMAKRLNLAVKSRSTLRVMVANWVRLSTQGLCRAVSWKAQGYNFTTDFLILSVKGFDLVLGIHWLLSLGPIAWNFSNLTMQFNHMRQNFILQGIVPSSLHIVPSSQLSKCLSLVGNDPCPMLLASCDQTALTIQPVQLPPDL
ncbi:uncharacterized protein [Gossypium hirsutum]|uniref:Uncharacterized protein n=1 Tax=Gossypium hirsutum TaxID=3635 RepID=A0A1U8MKA0_GOSHI|nr:uncharacterized protein LOC107938556 [Gossypium hirsutum]